MERTRVERERRRRAKLEAKSATVIQAQYRGWRALCATKRQARLEWQARYGSNGGALQAADCLAASAGGALGGLLFFCDPRQPEDAGLLAAAAAQVVLAAKTQGACGRAWCLVPRAGADRVVLRLFTRY